MEDRKILIERVIKNYIRAAYAFLPDEYHLGSLSFINKVREIEKAFLLVQKQELLANNNGFSVLISHISEDSSHKEYFLAFVNLYLEMIWALSESENRDPEIIKAKFNELDKEYGYKEFFSIYLQATQHYLELLKEEGLTDIRAV